MRVMAKVGKTVRSVAVGSGDGGSWEAIFMRARYASRGTADGRLSAPADALGVDETLRNLLRRRFKKIVIYSYLYYTLYQSFCNSNNFLIKKIF